MTTLLNNNIDISRLVVYMIRSKMKKRNKTKWERGNIRGPGILRRVKAYKILVKMAGSGLRRSREIPVHFLQLVPHILGHLVIDTFRETLGLSHNSIISSL